MVGQDFFLLLLNSSAWLCMGPAQQDSQNFLVLSENTRKFHRSKKGIVSFSVDATPDFSRYEEYVGTFRRIFPSVEKGLGQQLQVSLVQR